MSDFSISPVIAATDFTRDELRELERLISAAEGRFPDAFWSASEKINAALNAPRRSSLSEAPATALTKEERDALQWAIGQCDSPQHAASLRAIGARLSGSIISRLSGSSPSAAPTDDLQALTPLANLIRRSAIGVLRYRKVPGEIESIATHIAVAVGMANGMREAFVETFEAADASGTLQQDLTVGAAGGEATKSCANCNGDGYVLVFGNKKQTCDACHGLPVTPSSAGSGQ